MKLLSLSLSSLILWFLFGVYTYQFLNCDFQLIVAQRRIVLLYV